MTSRKRGTAVNGDLFVVEHPTLDLDVPFTSHVDVTFDGVTHQVLTTADRSGFSYEDTTGEFALGELRGHMLERLDTVAKRAVHRHQAIVSGATGALSVHGYDGSERLLLLLEALEPTATPLGMTIEPGDGVEIGPEPRVAMTTSIGVLEITPLTTSVDRQLPRWQGTSVAHGQLYAGLLADQRPYLTLVTPTARLIAMPAAGVDPDAATDVVAQLAVTWTR